jgi:hypothetical protein
MQGRVGVSAYRRRTCARGEADVGFLGAQRFGEEPLADNLSICYVIKGRPSSGVRIENICGCLPPIPPFSETMPIHDVYMSKRRRVAPGLEWDRLRLVVRVPYERAW